MCASPLAWPRRRPSVPGRRRRGSAASPYRERLRGFGSLALEDVSPRTSWRASREFRLQLIRELSGRALLEAARKGGAQL